MSEAHASPKASRTIDQISKDTAMLYLDGGASSTADAAGFFVKVLQAAKTTTSSGR